MLHIAKHHFCIKSSVWKVHKFEIQSYVSIRKLLPNENILLCLEFLFFLSILVPVIIFIVSSNDYLPDDTYSCYHENTENYRCSDCIDSNQRLFCVTHPNCRKRLADL